MTTQALSSLRTMLPVLIGLLLFGFGIYALNHLLHSVDPATVMAQIKATSGYALTLAIAATAIGYAALVGYDALALQFIGKSLPARVIAMGGFLGYAFGNTIGVSVISGGAVRYRIYSAFGLDAFDVATVSGYIAAALGTGLTLIGLAALSLHPTAVSQVIALPPEVTRVGALLILIATVGTIIFISAGNRRFRFWRMDLRLPPLRSLAAQLAITLIDVVAAAFALWILMPVGTPDLAMFIAIYAIATMIGILSHVPGGIGVFETIVIGTLPATVPISDAAAALVLFRIIYYLLPFGVGFIVVSLNEARLAGGMISRLLGRVPAASRPAVEALHSIAPSIAALMTFGLGAYLLLVSVFPSARSHAIVDGEFAAALLIEGGTLLSAMVGVVLLVLSHGLARRIKAAFLLTLLALGAGAVAALLNDLDVETAALLLAGVLLLFPFGGGFTRQAKLTEGVFSVAWLALVFGVAVAALGFFFFLHRTTPYSNDLWTEIAHGANTPRALRAGLLASALLLIFAIFTALRPVRRKPVTAQDPGILQNVSTILRRTGPPHGCLALSGDKQFLFSESGKSFIMYAVQGPRWVAYGDPVGDKAEFPSLCWAFIDLARKTNGQAVFYEIGTDNLPVFLEVGLGLHKVGEEAVVRLQQFSLGGSSFKSMRSAYNKSQRDGLSMTIVQPPHTAELLAELKTISDSWLGHKAGREKGFSVGQFDPAYLNRFPIALVRRDGQILAFANILAPGDGRQVAIDLMRYLPEDASGMMEFLFLSLIEHYREQGAAELSLGMAPLAGLSSKSVERLWNRFGRFIYRHGGAFYNFEGLRAFKQKFRPEWRPSYIAVPPGLSPTRAMADVALLIAGGPKGLIGK
ncbi:MAG: bifunctional lysylphosphatidylglycerol flippase/synthetase MprF [Rhodobacteraceae bacterium]|nr:bifunctional lysylphosphatidylglycerol flippase/synthetase MprF [Paracoccaceae bacterium]